MKSLLSIVLFLTISVSISSCSKGKKKEQEVTEPKEEAIIERVEYGDSWFWLGVPNTEKSKPLPIIVALHGDEGHPNNMKRFWETLWKDKQDFILLAPECPRGMCNKGGVNTWSNGGYENSQPQGLWLKNAINQVIHDYKADENRVFAVGYSGGAIFLGYQGFKMFQDVFAGIQWSCGGVNETEAQVYKAPESPDCKVPGRVVLSRNGDFSYLVTAADRIIEILKNNGHNHEFYDTGCDGHCCNASEYSENTYNWFMSLPPKCGE